VHARHGHTFGGRTAATRRRIGCAKGWRGRGCLTGHAEDSLRHLDEAIHINPSLRFQARNDSDFQNLAEDPRFTEMLYPDPGAEPSAAESAEER